MELLGDVGHLEFTSFSLEIVLVSVQDGCMFCAKRTISLEISWTHPMVLLADEAQVKPCFGPFGDSDIL